MRMLNHPNIVKLLEVNDVEYLSGGDLFTHLEALGPTHTYHQVSGSHQGH